MTPRKPATPPKAPTQNTPSESRIYALVLAVAKDEGRETDPAWLVETDQAKRRGYLREERLRLYLTPHGRQWLAIQEPGARRGYTMQKLDHEANLQLRDLSHDTGVTMREVIGLTVGCMHANRDRLTRYARAHGGEHPWDAIAPLLAHVKA